MFWSFIAFLNIFIAIWFFTILPEPAFTLKFILGLFICAVNAFAGLNLIVSTHTDKRE